MLILVVRGVWVVCPVHQDGCRVVVDSDIHHPPRCKLNAGAGTAAAGEAVYDLLCQKVYLPSMENYLTM